MKLIRVRVNALVTNGDRRHAGNSSVSFVVMTYAATPSGEAYHFDADLK